MYVCIYVCIHVSTYLGLYVGVYACIYVCIHTSTIILRNQHKHNLCLARYCLMQPRPCPPDCGTSPPYRPRAAEHCHQPDTGGIFCHVHGLLLLEPHACRSHCGSCDVDPTILFCVSNHPSKVPGAGCNPRALAYCIHSWPSRSGAVFLPKSYCDPPCTRSDRISQPELLVQIHLHTKAPLDILRPSIRPRQVKPQCMGISCTYCRRERLKERWRWRELPLTACRCLHRRVSRRRGRVDGLPGATVGQGGALVGLVGLHMLATEEIATEPTLLLIRPKNLAVQGTKRPMLWCVPSSCPSFPISRVPKTPTNPSHHSCKMPTHMAGRMCPRTT